MAGALLLEMDRTWVRKRELREVLYPDTPFDLEESLVLLCRRGSESQGTFIPSDDPDSIDDRDLMGVCVPPKPYYLGLSEWSHVEAIKEQWDVALYEYRKFVRLLMKQNPNVIGMLWLEDEDYLLVSPTGQELITHRNLFKHRRLAFTSFGGYANSQLKKMTSGAFKGYMGAKRKALVEKHGYDTKNAAHLVRLLHMGEEYLRTGEMQVKRTWDRELLIDVKRGGWSLEKVQRYATEYFAKLSRAHDKSDLPEELDFEAIEDVVVRSLERRLDG